MAKRGMTSVTGNLASTDWQVMYGELKLTGDANDGAAVKIGEWRADRHYVVGAHVEASPAAFAAIPWQNSFFLSACTGLSVGAPYNVPKSVIDYGAGALATSAGNRPVYPGMRGTGTTAVLVDLINDGVGGWPAYEIKFLSNGDITKQWLGNAGGNDDYMFLVSRSIL